MRGEKVDVLDDSELSGTVVEYHSTEALADDLAVLEKADVSALSAMEARRFNALKEAARYYLKIVPEELEKARANQLKGRKWRESCRSFGPNKGFD